ncbi:MAG: Uma2 family endonuclease [Bacteroidia bacterium]
MGAVRKLSSFDLPHYRISDWEQWEGKWELVRGIPFAMAPAPSRKHQLLNFLIGNAFLSATKTCGKCRPELEINYRVSEDTVLEPDLVIVCGDLGGGNYLETTPSLVMEVLSPTTAQNDLNVKSRIYAEQGIRYYLIVHPDEEWIRIQELGVDDWVELDQFRDGSFTFDFDGCKVEVDFSGVWK